MAQQNINFGTFPDDPDADAIRTAFNKVQQNFTEVYNAGAGASVTSINRNPGACRGGKGGPDGRLRRSTVA